MESFTSSASNLRKNLKKLHNLHVSFDYLQITLASPEKIKAWAERKLPNQRKIGRIFSWETIHFRTNKPQPFGLFCQITFGPVNNWECDCGRYVGFAVNNLDRICETCFVEITESRVRRYRMGYIPLGFPVVHSWYLRSVPSYLLLFLRAFLPKLNLSNIERVIYFKERTDYEDSIDTLTNPLSFFYRPKTKKEIDETVSFLTDCLEHVPEAEELEEATRFGIEEGIDPFPTEQTMRRGAELVKAGLEFFDINDELNMLRRAVKEFCLHFSTKATKKRNVPDFLHLKRLRLLESFHQTQTQPSWMVLTVLPILPPSLRPLVELEDGKLITSDLNEFYRLAIIRNNRLYKYTHMLETIYLAIYNERKNLQQIVDNLIDNGRLQKKKILNVNEQPLKSLTEILEGKEGRFRQTLLGKRVDYSGRSVIVVNPLLRVNQCGLPFKMALELFEPFLINEYLTKVVNPPNSNIKLAQGFLQQKRLILWRYLEKVCCNLTILLNRAPTLHRFGIQAFEPVLILGQAIHLHPLVCTGFNADFDGDQMAVHVPLQEVSQIEAKYLMRPSGNILSPASGDPILKPTQDMVIGCYYLTLMLEHATTINKPWFASEKEALACLYQKSIQLHQPILVRYATQDFNIKIQNNQLTLCFFPLDIFEFEAVHVHKIFERNFDTLYLVTNLGICIARRLTSLTFEIFSIFLQTTPGRILFRQNLELVFHSTKLNEKPRIY
ncbi:MAG: DNA-directed RNA polymerase subunit gamma [Pedobacter sp.]|nr:MAG: DNA-directed RNA polymerase subunit gamma [Pedobacter sp.]